MLVGCHNRQSKQCGLSFYRFPKDKDHRCLWVAFISRRNPDGSPWQPGTDDCVCSEHFIFKRKSDLPSSPDFVPSVQRKELELPVCSTTSSEVSYRRFNHARSRARIREQHCKELEMNRRAVELDQARLSDIRLAITHDHTYACSERELVSVEEPLSEELVMQDQVSLQDQELLSWYSS